MSKASDRFISVVHGETDTRSLVIEDLDTLGFTALGGVDKFKRTCTRNDKILGLVLVTVSVSSNNNGLFPARNNCGDSGNDNGLTENSTAKDVSNGTVGRKPHLLEVEFLHTGLIRSDGGTLDTDLVLDDGLSSINSDPIVSLVTVLDTKIVVLEIDVDERKDKFILDELPNDSGHFITVKFDNGVLDLDLFKRRGWKDIELANCIIIVKRDMIGTGTRDIRDSKIKAFKDLVGQMLHYYKAKQIWMGQGQMNYE